MHVFQYSLLEESDTEDSVDKKKKLSLANKNRRGIFTGETKHVARNLNHKKNLVNMVNNSVYYSNPPRCVARWHK